MKPGLTCPGFTISLKYGKLATKSPRIYGYFYSVTTRPASSHHITSHGEDKGRFPKASDLGKYRSINVLQVQVQTFAKLVFLSWLQFVQCLCILFFYLTVLFACMICFYYDMCDCHAFIKGNLLTYLLTVALTESPCLSVVFHPGREGYVALRSACLHFVGLSASISQKPDVQTSPNFRCVLPVVL